MGRNKARDDDVEKLITATRAVYETKIALNRTDCAKMERNGT
jgi:hypothetical protein